MVTGPLGTWFSTNPLVSLSSQVTRNLPQLSAEDVAHLVDHRGRVRVPHQSDDGLAILGERDGPTGGIGTTLELLVQVGVLLRERLFSLGGVKQDVLDGPRGPLGDAVFRSVQEGPGLLVFEPIESLRVKLDGHT